MTSSDETSQLTVRFHSPPDSVPQPLTFNGRRDISSKMSQKCHKTPHTQNPNSSSSPHNLILHLHSTPSLGEEAAPPATTSPSWKSTSFLTISSLLPFFPLTFLAISSSLSHHYCLCSYSHFPTEMKMVMMIVLLLL